MIKDRLSGLDPYQGVPVDLFVSERVRLWREEGHGDVDPSANLIDAWEHLCRWMNVYLINSCKVGGRHPDYEPYLEDLKNAGGRNVHDHDTSYRYALETGGGKSTGIRLWFAMLGGIARTPEKCPSALVTAQRIEECDIFMEEVNRLGTLYGMEQPMAVAFHSKAKSKTLSYASLKDWPFVASTQKGLILGLIEDGIDGLYFKRLKAMTDYKHAQKPSLDHSFNPIGKRDMYVMDETLSPFAAFNVHQRTLDEILEGIPDELAADHKAILYGIDALLTEIRMHKRFARDGEEGDLKDWREFAPSVLPLINGLKFSQSGLEHWKVLMNLISVYFLQAGPVVFKVRGEIHSLFKA